LLLWFLFLRTYLYVIIRATSYNCGGYTALALVVQETSCSLSVVTLSDVRMACRFGYRTASSHMRLAGKECAIWKGGSYIYLPRQSNGPDLLDELLNDFIWFLVFWN
jgi:hypothetical protein